MAGNRNSGRRPQPTALKVLRGNPGKRQFNQAEPKPEIPGEAFDEPPMELTGDGQAQDEWRRLAPMLRRLRVVTEAERGQLIALCQQWSRYREAHGKVGQLGLVVRGPKGNPIVNPYLTIADRALAHCSKLWTELGLTPSSRSRIAALPAVEEPKSKWAGIL